MHIEPGNLRWYAAYHNAEGHPHVHMLVWSKSPHEPYLSTVGIHNIKKTIAADIFRQDNISNYKRQTQARDDLKEQFRVRIAEINKEIQRGTFSVSAELVYKLEELSVSLEKHKGKKVYGYLSKKNKDMVDEIVKMIAKDKKIVGLYDLWYRLQCENYRNYTDQMPEKIPLESNKEFKSLRNFVVRSASEMITDIPEPSEFDDDYIYHRKYGDNETVLKFKAEDGYLHEQYLYARRLLEDDEPNEAEYWLKKSSAQGNHLAMYMLYKCYRDGKIEDREGEKMKYLLMAVDKEYGFAEYEYSKLRSKTKSDMAIEYMRQASRHGCPMAEYAVGKLFLERGNTDLALPYLESAASKNPWARFYLGLVYYYKLDDKEKGMGYLRMAEEQNFEPAHAAITQIEYGYNARIVAGVFNLFYYAGCIPILRPSTYAGYSKDIANHILPHLGSKRITQLKTADIQKHYNRLLESGRIQDNGKGKGLSNATVRGIHMVLREALDSAVREGLIPKNPADGTSPPKIYRNEKQVLTKDQLETFMKLIEGDEEWYDFFYTEIITGMRQGEICGLRWEDFDREKRTLRVARSVDFVNKELVVGETKTEDGKRTIYLPDSLWHILAERQSQKGAFSEWIFPNLLKPEWPLNPSRAYRQLKKLLEIGGLPSIRFHDLRHTFTSHAANSGIDPKTLSEIVGHSKASFTLDHYAHVTSDIQKNAANIVTNYITDILGKELKPWQNAEKQVKDR